MNWFSILSLTIIWTFADFAVNWRRTWNFEVHDFCKAESTACISTARYTYSFEKSRTSKFKFSSVYSKVRENLDFC